MQINYILQVKNNPPEATKGTNTGSGTAAQIDVKGDDSFGIITVNTGDNPYGQNICSILFLKPYGSDNLIVEVNPYNRQAKAIGAVAGEAEEGTGFEINSSVELNDNDVYQWTYRVTEILY